MALITTLIRWVIPRSTRFKPGDCVQHTPTGPLMVVTWVKHNSLGGPACVICKWFDSETKTTHTNLFKEDELSFFNWNLPNTKSQNESTCS